MLPNSTGSTTGYDHDNLWCHQCMATNLASWKLSFPSLGFGHERIITFHICVGSKTTKLPLCARDDERQKWINHLRAELFWGNHKNIWTFSQPLFSSWKWHRLLKSFIMKMRIRLFYIISNMNMVSNDMTTPVAATSGAYYCEKK